MKKIIAIFFVLAAFSVKAQYSNNWIDYTKTYYKFKVGSNGLCHISQSTLSSLGLGAVPAEQFQVWKNGEQIALYTSAPSGTLPTNGYIEFWGEINDGKPDKQLYFNPDFQLNDHYSLFTDTSAYFLTVNPGGGNLRFTDENNNVSGTTLTPEPYFMNVIGNYFKDRINPGQGQLLDTYLYSAAYDRGEGWTSNDIAPNIEFHADFSMLNLYKNGPNATLRFALAGNALNQRKIRVKIFNTVLDEEPMDYFNYLKKEITSIPMSVFSDLNNLQVTFENVSSVITDRMVVSYNEVTYPSTFNFNNKTDFYFQLPATTEGNYLVIDNFNYGSHAPVLFDLTSKKRYTGDISTPGKVKFVLPASSASVRAFRLCTEDPAIVKNIVNIEKRNFINYGNAANQGTYLIISNPVLYSSTSGDNNVELYRQYRNSAAGGNFNAKIVDINELTDQFAYGIKKNPRAIKDFIQFAAAKFSVVPRYLFVIGKGIEYDQYTPYQSGQFADKLNLVPTFGSPASDVLLASPYGSVVPLVPVGRIPAINGDEVGNYLQKIKEYETASHSSSQTLDNKLWMKKIVHIAGGGNNEDNLLFSTYLGNYKGFLEDTLFGGNVEMFSKSSSTEVQLIANQRINDLFSSGIGILNYFGHSSSTSLAFNLNDPSDYNNAGKYPFFLVSGCTAGNNFIFDSLRILLNKKTISENFVLSKEKGSIAFLASTHFGVPLYLNDYNTSFYKLLSNTDYGNSIGNYMQKTIKALGGDNPSLYLISRLHLEEFCLNGDPALTLNPQAKPDYVADDQYLKISPQFISVSAGSFNLNAKVFNIGRAINDSVTLEIKRTYPDGSAQVLIRKRIKAPYYADSISMDVPIIATRDKGLNKLTVTIDADHEIEELSETNNSFTREVFIYADEANPIYPANYAIINIANQKLYASTSNPLNEMAEYTLEIDTSGLFNSPSKVSRSIQQIGGILEFDPGFSYVNNTVYYWRVAQKPASGNATDYHWNQSSFIYLSGSSEGANQSHFYQHQASGMDNISLPAGSRQWTFDSIPRYLYAKSAVFPDGSSVAQDDASGIDGLSFAAGICPGGTENVLIINVLDPFTLKPWMNSLGGTTGISGSLPVCASSRQPNFAYLMVDIEGRKAAKHFLDSIPDGYFVFVRNVSSAVESNMVFADKWKADAAILGNGNTLYDELKTQGFADIDSFYRPRAFAFIYKKNTPSFGPVFGLSNGIIDVVNVQKNFYISDSLGYITSPAFGPALAWKELHWRGSSLENNSPDNPVVEVTGIDPAGNSTLLYTVDKSQQDLNISSVDAARYPYIRLRMRNSDSLKFTPYQLDYWRLNYQTPPEGALAPNVFFRSKDTLDQGETLSFGIAFKNISLQAFDSMKIKMEILDKNNVTHAISLPRRKPLVSGDTLTLKYDIETKGLGGANTLYVNFNPDNDQPEQYLFNNFIYKNFYVKEDIYNPLLDVTFDGVHILNRDIVSARPHITIKLKDENKSLALNDTSLFKVQIIGPDGTARVFHFDNDTMRFTPANLASGENTATVDLMPSLPGEDADYELVVSGKDAIGNPSGTLDYHIHFRVINKPMISNLLNYPNPFTSSTAFVFTVTGFEIPQNIRIQILTITGKVIREITKEELGPIHIGRNITEFKWDGTDRYGQKVANGVYLYRVLTNLNGRAMDKFKDENDNTDKYFTKGYGKMYLMR